MSSPAAPQEAQRRYLWLVASFVLFGASLAIFESNFPNLLRERFGIGEWFRGFLEFPRESQGFAVVFYVVGLGMLTERRLYALAAGLSGIGLLGLALLPGQSIADDLSGIGPAAPLLLLVMVHSAGFHLAVMMERYLVLDHGDLAAAGRRLGRVGVYKTLAALVGAGSVWIIRRLTPADFGFFLTLAAGLAFASVIVMYRGMKGLPGVRPQRRRFVFKRKFLRYYALSALFGVRKQVFITFAAWVIVVIYEQPASTMALLWVLASAANLATQPLLGRLIDRAGPRTVLVADALALVVVCLVYATVERAFPPALALIVTGATYVADNVLFFAGSARAVYVGTVADSPDEIATTLSFGVTIDHVFSMSVPLLGGVIWKAYGYPWVFVLAAATALVTALVAAGIPGGRVGAGRARPAGGPELSGAAR